MDDDADCTSLWDAAVAALTAEKAEKAALGLAPGSIQISSPQADRKQGEVWKEGKEWKIRIAQIVRGNDDNDLLKKLFLDGSIKDLVCANSDMIEKIDRVGKTNPHFSNVIDLFRRHILASKNTKRPIRIPHILLIGDPGIGKTHVLREIASAIGLPFSCLDAPGLTGAGVFSGTDKSWTVLSTRPLPILTPAFPLSVREPGF